MTEKMRAAIFTGDKELRIEEREIPIPKDDELVIKIAACGVCHTDEGYIQGTPTYKKLPIILGHEASGYVKQIGANVKDFTIDDPVLIPPVLTCGTCRFCREGRSNICLKQQMLGNHIDGAFAEYICVRAKDIVKIPKSLPIKDVAIVSDAIGTPYHAVFGRAKVQPGDIVVVIGCGGIGINIVQFAALAGAKVIAIDIQVSKLKLAKELGADYIIDPNTHDVKNRVRELVKSVDIVFEVIGNPVTQKQALDLLGPGGKMIAVGYSPKRWDGFQSGKIMFYEIDLIGSYGCPPQSFPRILHLIDKGMIQLDPLITHRFPLSEINAAFEQLRKGDGVRILIEM
ncbi:MAG: zinc-dependent alcohol dehydrogenase [Candidatus Kariarchaeaceae archaeon]